MRGGARDVLSVKWYTVWDAKTDRLIACGYAREVAERLHTTRTSFISNVSRYKAGKTKSRYDYYVESASATTDTINTVIAEGDRVGDYLRHVRDEIDAKPELGNRHKAQRAYREYSLEDFIHWWCAGDQTDPYRGLNI